MNIVSQSSIPLFFFFFLLILWNSLLSLWVLPACQTQPRWNNDVQCFHKFIKVTVQTGWAAARCVSRNISLCFKSKQEFSPHSAATFIHVPAGRRTWAVAAPFIFIWSQLLLDVRLWRGRAKMDNTKSLHKTVNSSSLGMRFINVNCNWDLPSK